MTHAPEMEKAVALVARLREHALGPHMHPELQDDITEAADELEQRRLLSFTRQEIARAFFEAGQKKAAEHGHHLPAIGWEQPGDEADQIRSLFLAGADALLAMFAEQETP